MSNKYLLLSIAMVFLMTSLMMMYPAIASVPTSPTGAGGIVQNPNTLVEDVPYGGGPATVDPAAAYDTASLELLQNAYDTLIFFNGEQSGNIPLSGVSNEYLPGLATQVTVGPPPAGAPAYTNFTVYFDIRGTDPVTGAGTVPFQTWSRADLGNLTWSQYYLTAQDVAYSFDRNIVHAYAFEGSYWLITDALLQQDAIYNDNLTSTNAPPGYTFTDILENAVQYNNTCCWFNIPNLGFATGTSVIPYVNMFNPDGSFNLNFWSSTGALNIDYQLNTFFQVWAQPWASIVSYDWTVNWLNPYLYAHGVNDTLLPPGAYQNGYSLNTGDEIEWTFADWNNWTDYFNPQLPVYDEVATGPTGITGAGGVTCGTGPYILADYNNAGGGSYNMTRFVNYWGGWPASWPDPPYPPQPASDCKPEGWVDNFEVVQTSTIAQGVANLAAGTADFAYVPLTQAQPLFQGYLFPTPVNAPPYFDNPTIPGVQCNYPIPTLETESFFMNQNVSATPGNPYGEIDGVNVWTGTGIPSNFFSDVNIRKMFAYCINETFYIQDQFLGRAYEPVTCAPDGFPYINSSQPYYTIDMTQAAYYMGLANTDSNGNLTSIGFTLDLIYNLGNSEREAMMENLATMVNSLNPNFHCAAVGVVWGTELTVMTEMELPTFMTGWLADYAGLQDFMLPYMDSESPIGISGGSFAMWTGYSNPTADALLQQTAYINNATLLAVDYGQLEQIYYDDVPSVTLIVPVGTGFQRDWVQGHYYNPLYPGIYAYNIWKYNAIPGDVNRDGKVDMSDVIDVLKAFGSYYGQFETGGGYWPTMQSRWNFYCDIIGTPREEWTDRVINMGDVVTVLQHFGEVDTPTGSAGGAPYWNGAWNETSGWYGVT